MTEPKELPFVAYQHEVKAILKNGRVQFRRVMRPQPQSFKGGVHPNHTSIHPAPYIDSYCSERKTEKNPRGMSRFWCWWTEDNRQGPDVGKCPYGQPGTNLWLKETFCLWDAMTDDYEGDLHRGKLPIPDQFSVHSWKKRVQYHASTKCDRESYLWRSSIHMPRWASRISMEVTSVRVERVRDITEDDARATGVTPSGVGDDLDYLKYRAGYLTLWDDINAKSGYSWDSNPWVWVGEALLIK